MAEAKETAGETAAKNITLPVRRVAFDDLRAPRDYCDLFEDTDSGDRLFADLDRLKPRHMQAGVRAALQQLRDALVVRGKP